MNHLNKSTKLTYQIISVSLSLTLVGLFLLYSIKPEFFFNQLPAVLLGVSLMIGLGLIPFNKLLSLTYPIYITNLGLLAAVFASPAIRGSHRWLNLFNFHIQPSELFKFSLILFSWRLVYEIFLPHTKGRSKIKLGQLIITRLPTGLKAKTAWLRPLSDYLSYKLNSKLTLITISFAIGLGLVLIEPDLGTFLFLALSLSLAWLMTIFFNLKRFIFILVVGALFIPFAWYQLKPYQQQRLVAFTDPYLDPQKSGYNIIQAQLTLKNGGLWGNLKPTSQYQKLLPESHTDFIFSVWVEDTGFAGGLILISLYLILIYLINKSLSFLTTPEIIPLILIISFLSLQAFIHIAINLSLLPVTGLTLPFISYGRSSIVSNFAILGLLLSRLNGKNHSFLESQILNQKLKIAKLKSNLTPNQPRLTRKI